MKEIEKLRAELEEWKEWKKGIEKLLADNKKTFIRVLAEKRWMKKYVELAEGSMWKDRMNEELRKTAKTIGCVINDTRNH